MLPAFSLKNMEYMCSLLDLVLGLVTYFDQCSMGIGDRAPCLSLGLERPGVFPLTFLHPGIVLKRVVPE